MLLVKETESCATSGRIVEAAAYIDPGDGLCDYCYYREDNQSLRIVLGSGIDP